MSAVMREDNAQSCLFTVGIRWFVENCCEIRLSNGTAILIDPCLPDKGERMAERGFYCGYTVEDLDRCDYVIINHTHGDHVWSLGKVVEKFDPRIIVSSACALQLIKVYQLKNPYRVFPVEQNQEYDFGDFRLHTYGARHLDVYTMSGGKAGRPSRDFSADEEEDLLNEMGAVFNLNYLITTPNNYRIAFDAGLYQPYLNDWHEEGPNLLMRHVDPPVVYGSMEAAVKNMADTLECSGAQYMLLNCVQAAYQENSTFDLKKYIDDVNGILAERGCPSRVFDFRMGKRFAISTQIAEVGDWTESE